VLKPAAGERLALMDGHQQVATGPPHRPPGIPALGDPHLTQSQRKWRMLDVDGLSSRITTASQPASTPNTTDRRSSRSRTRAQRRIDVRETVKMAVVEAVVEADAMKGANMGATKVATPETAAAVAATTVGEGWHWHCK